MYPPEPPGPPLPPSLHRPSRLRAARTPLLRPGRLLPRLLPCAAALLLLLSLALPAPAPARAETETAIPAAPATFPTQADPQWAVTLGEAVLYSQSNEDSLAFELLRDLSPLQILGYEGEWAYVFNPRTRGTAYVRSDQLGPSDPPSRYVSAEAPPVEEELNQVGRIVSDTSLALYPTPNEEAVRAPIGSGTPVAIAASVRGEDGELWYRTDDGDYLASGAVTFAPSPAAPVAWAISAPVRTFAGRWLDVNLSEPARITAYVGDTPVRSFLTIKGRGRSPTPVGVFRIQRRVANETMDSATVGIPRNAPGGYYLTNVLYTQYFLPTGESLHYNYWSSNWGYAGSNGCLGLSYADSAWLWEWATIGTPLSIHY